MARSVVTSFGLREYSQSFSKLQKSLNSPFPPATALKLQLLHRITLRLLPPAVVTRCRHGGTMTC